MHAKHRPSLSLSFLDTASRVGPHRAHLHHFRCRCIYFSCEQGRQTCRGWGRRRWGRPWWASCSGRARDAGRRLGCRVASGPAGSPIPRRRPRGPGCPAAGAGAAAAAAEAAVVLGCSRSSLISRCSDTLSLSLSLSLSSRSRFASARGLALLPVCVYLCTVLSSLLSLSPLFLASYPRRQAYARASSQVAPPDRGNIFFSPTPPRAPPRGDLN